jgi:hypothetical protein
MDIDWKKIAEAAGALVGIAAAAGLAIRISTKRSSNNTKVTQKGNKVGGDNAGRDINK